MGNLVDIVGQQFGYLTVIAYSGKDKNRHSLWKCRCVCGEEIIVVKSSLISGDTKSCGKCHRHKTRQVIHPGDRFGNLMVIEKEICTGRAGTYWRCLCDCGKETIVSTSHLNSGHTRSCGHLAIRKTHGMSNTNFYHVYRGIRQRCCLPTHSSYSDYGGRGIKCLWNTFEEFYNDMYESYRLAYNKYGRYNTTIERVDNNGNYCKENCRWVTQKEQAQNKRSNRRVMWNGVSYTISQLADRFNIPYSILYGRLYSSNWDITKVMKSLNYKEVCDEYS